MSPSHLLFCSKRKKERKKKAQQTSRPKIDDRFFFHLVTILKSLSKSNPESGFQTQAKHWDLLKDTSLRLFRSGPLGVPEWLPVVCILLQGPPRDKQEFALTPANNLELQVGPRARLWTTGGIWRPSREPRQTHGTGKTDTHSLTPLGKSSEPTTLLLRGHRQCELLRHWRWH